MKMPFLGPFKEVSFADYNCEPGQVLSYTDKDGENIAMWQCPCGCGDNHAIWHSGSKSPFGHSWDYKIDENKLVTVHASYQANGGKCRSHYFMRNGFVEFC